VSQRPTHLTWADRGSKPSLRGEKPATNHLNHALFETENESTPHTYKDSVCTSQTTQSAYITKTNQLTPYRKKRESIPFIFNDESTASCICLRLDLYMSHVKITRATADCFCFLCSPTPSTTRSHTCAYVTRIAFVFILVSYPFHKPLPHMCSRNAYCFCFYLSSPTPPTNRSHTCAYVTYCFCFYLSSPTLPQPAPTHVLT
jgi:hypothetical protein